MTNEVFNNTHIVETTKVLRIVDNLVEKLVDAGRSRITYVADAIDPLDAVNKQTLKAAIDEFLDQIKEAIELAKQYAAQAEAAAKLAEGFAGDAEASAGKAEEFSQLSKQYADEALKWALKAQEWAEYVRDFIDDSVVALDKTYSSQKIVDTINAAIESAKTELRGDIDSAKAELNGNIDSAKQELEAAIDALRGSLDGLVTTERLKAELLKIADLISEGDLNVTTILMEKINELKGLLKGDITNNTESITNITQQIENIKQQIENIINNGGGSGGGGSDGGGGGGGSVEVDLTQIIEDYDQFLNDGTPSSNGRKCWSASMSDFITRDIKKLANDALTTAYGYDTRISELIEKINNMQWSFDYYETDLIKLKNVISQLEGINDKFNTYNKLFGYIGRGISEMYESATSIKAELEKETPDHAACLAAITKDMSGLYTILEKLAPYENTLGDA